MTVSYIEAITAANRDIIERVYRIETHGISERFTVHKDASNVREITGRTRIFTIEWDRQPDTVTYGSDTENTETTGRIIIGYNVGFEFDLAANADILAIRHMLANLDSAPPDGVAFYLFFYHQKNCHFLFYILNYQLPLQLRLLIEFQ